MKRLLIFTILTLFGCYTATGQVSLGNKGIIGPFEGEEYQARIDIVSNVSNLNIQENNGEIVQAPVERADGKFVYTCICDVTDTNTFGFQIAVQGTADTEELKVYIEEGQHMECEVNIEQVPVAIVPQITNSSQIIPKENTAAITVICDNGRLKINSITGEEVSKPQRNANEVFEYTIYFDLTDEKSRETTRSLVFSLDYSDEVICEIGTLSPKQGVEVKITILQKSCYQETVRQAGNFYMNNLYKESYATYKSAMNCEDKPENTADITTRMNKTGQLAVALQRAQQNYEIAERFNREGKLDSSLVYHNEAYKYRNAILKENSSDTYCLEYHRKYEDFKSTFPRTVSGRVLNGIQMDINKNNLPLSGAYIVCKTFAIERKKVNKIWVPTRGKEIESKQQLLGTTDEKGNFQVMVPRNTSQEMYVLYITDDNEFKGGSNAQEYIPTDADIQKDLIIKIIPRGINKNN